MCCCGCSLAGALIEANAGISAGDVQQRIMARPVGGDDRAGRAARWTPSRLCGWLALGRLGTRPPRIDMSRTTTP